MPETPGARFGLAAISGSDHIDDIDTIDQAQIALLEAKGMLFGAGTLVARPTSSGGTPGITGRLYYATDSRTLYYDTGAGWLQLSTSDAPSRGACSIATSESRTNTAYGLLATPDQVAGIVLPADGLIAVCYQATWQNSVVGAGEAAIFLGSNQLQVQGWDATTGHQPLPQSACGAPAGLNTPLFTVPVGLATGTSATAFNNDATTGQAIGAFLYSGALGAKIGAQQTTFQFTNSTIMLGGRCYIFAAAGTYTVSVQFKASSGSVTASNRKLWCQALSFS
jgi:hypothetical protein